MKNFSVLSILSVVALVTATQSNATENSPEYQISPALVSGLKTLDPTLFARISDASNWKPTDPSLFNGADKSSELEIFRGKNSVGEACRLVVEKDSDQPGRLTFRVDRDISAVNTAIPTTFDTFALSSPSQPDNQWHHFIKESVQKQSIQLEANEVDVLTQVKIDDTHGGSKETSRYSDKLILKGFDGGIKSIEDQQFQDSRTGRGVQYNDPNCTAE